MPKSGEEKRTLKFEEFIHIALGDGIKKYPHIQIPYRILLAAHFTRADAPAFAEFKKDIDSRLALNLDALRKSFVTRKKDIKVNLLTK